MWGAAVGKRVYRLAYTPALMRPSPLASPRAPANGRPSWGVLLAWESGMHLLYPWSRMLPIRSMCWKLAAVGAGAGSVGGLASCMLHGPGNCRARLLICGAERAATVFCRKCGDTVCNVHRGVHGTCGWFFLPVAPRPIPGTHLAIWTASSIVLGSRVSLCARKLVGECTDEVWLSRKWHEADTTERFRGFLHLLPLPVCTLFPHRSGGFMGAGGHTRLRSSIFCTRRKRGPSSVGAPAASGCVKSCQGAANVVLS